MNSKGLRGLPAITLLLLAITLVVAIIPTEAEAAIYDDTVRLHIRARSDNDYDQTVKLQIRDRLLEKYSHILADCNKDAALDKLSSRLYEIKQDIDGWLLSLGCDYSCKVSLGTEWFETREYENFTLPAGEYCSLIVELGEGDGANWWCVMYPPMCLDIATEVHSDYTDKEQQLISGGRYRLRFKLLELAAELTR